MQIFLIILGLLLVLVIVVYIIVFSKTILRSEIPSFKGDIEADHYYYLPEAQMSLAVTAVIKVERSITDKTIINHQLMQFNFNPVVTVKPDRGSLVALQYKGNWFSNDDLHITTSTEALLDNVSAISEDRIGPIVAQITNTIVGDSSKRFLEAAFVEKEPTQKSITEILEITRIFTITADELAGAEISKSWLVPLTGEHTGDTIVADASFTLINADSSGLKPVTAGMMYDGLLSRPLIAQKWTLKTKDADVISFVCMVPDTGSLLKIPVRRSYFIKKQQLPKFQQGLLVENSINKPSEIEGLISIPLNIAKAIFSIPAQLLQFKISHINQQTEYEKSLAALQKARESAGEKASADALKRITDEWEEIKKRQYLSKPPVTENRNEDAMPALGKLPPKPLPAIAEAEEKDIQEIFKS